MTFITSNLCQTLRLRRIRKPLSISAVGCLDAGTCQYATRIQISLCGQDKPLLSITASILKSLTTYTPPSDISSFQWDHLADLALADPNLTRSDPIDLLIGADLYSEIILEGLRKSARGHPLAQNTIFGWILSGPTSLSAPSPQRITVQHCLNPSTLEQELKKFWEVEEISHSNHLHPDERQCEEHFLSTHSRRPDGHYVVRLPFKKGPPINIGDSRQRAEKLLQNLHRRLSTRQDLKNEYIHFMREYEQLGHMQKIIDPDSSSTQRVYIPHHPVIRDSSVTTHLRVVFNASSTTTNSTSLNDHLLVGPKLQPDLAAVILRWRQYQYVYSADITKMYRQILIDPRDINYQRILWSPELSEPIQEYQLLTVTYETASAPYLALRVLRQLIHDHGRSFPLAVPILHENTYVDDVLFGADDVSHLVQFRHEICALLSKGHFQLRKWSSNSSELLCDIASDNHGLACSKLLQPDENLKILGVSWTPSTDTFQFKVSLPDIIPMSKRTILSLVAKIFDPLGWSTPVTVTAKILLQQLWQRKLDWDDVIPPDLHSRWRSISTSLSALESIQIDRWIHLGAEAVHCELHGFADTSTVAYAASVHLRVISLTGTVTTSLLVGKSKVAPVKTLSVPRLELLAAVLLSRLVEFVRISLHLSTLPCYCWTDSMVVLAWLSRHPSGWKTFVADIQDRLASAIWRYVPTQVNPADCASRGISDGSLASLTLWWHGPEWLLLDKSKWPKHLASPSTSDEERPQVTSHVARSVEPWDLSYKFSSWHKLLRITAYVLRFITRLRRSPQSDSIALSNHEFQRAHEFWIKQIQSEVFSLELNALNNKRPLSKGSPLLALNPFLDEASIIRVGGRLLNASLPFTTKHPIILASHPLVTLIIRQAHIRHLHSGVQLTLAALRRDYWILHARCLVRAEIYKCVNCTRERAVTHNQLMGNLPPVRVVAPTRAFLHCGVDYAGPILVRPISGRGVPSHKAYIAIFVCLATRAIHLELVEGCSTPAFLAAFERFCARRGLPESVYSDNGTNFVGVDRELKRAFRAALHNPDFQNRTKSDGISWKFIPPSAPHFGGLWEAEVKSVKHHMRRVMGSHTLTFEELMTLLCNIEACLNSRLLAPFSASCDDYDALTPEHFLIGSAITRPRLNPPFSISKKIAYRVGNLFVNFRNDFGNYGKTTILTLCNKESSGVKLLKLSFRWANLF